MSLPRFLIPDLAKSGIVAFPDAEAHHASRVLRCKAGESVVLFDGIGNEALAVLKEIDKRSVQADIVEWKFAPRDHLNRLHFAVALPKGDRQRSTIEKLVELGVDSLTPLETERSVAVVDDSNTDRLERYVVEACKQCGRNRLMRVEPSVSIKQLLCRLDAVSAWILHPESDSIPSYSIRQANHLALETPPASLYYLVGPEGGFTTAEVAMAHEGGVRVLSLGDRIQRVETAVSTAAVLGHCWLT
jgi:16S rRNA (uracil1498-N3)-methyltransferase